MVIQIPEGRVYLSAQVHAEDTGPDKPLMECDPIQLAIFSHRSALHCNIYGHAAIPCLYNVPDQWLDQGCVMHGGELLAVERMTFGAWCRFMGIAEQMGRVLQRTSISVNIKERLDFSCALFGPDGSLVANAPHLPVHLGAMSEAIRYQVHCMHSTLKVVFAGNGPPVCFSFIQQKAADTCQTALVDCLTSQLEMRSDVLLTTERHQIYILGRRSSTGARRERARMRGCSQGMCWPPTTPSLPGGPICRTSPSSPPSSARAR